jgi:hypothetical protein
MRVVRANTTGQYPPFLGRPAAGWIELTRGAPYSDTVVRPSVRVCPSKRRRGGHLDPLVDPDGGVPAAARRGERLHPVGGPGACRAGRRDGNVRTAPRYRPPRGPGPSTAVSVRPPWPPLARTNLGALSEPLRAASAGAMVVSGPDPAALAAAAVRVLALPVESRLALGARGAELYRSEFSLEGTIARLHQPGPTSHGPIHC